MGGSALWGGGRPVGGGGVPPRRRHVHDPIRPFRLRLGHLFLFQEKDPVWGKLSEAAANQLLTDLRLGKCTALVQITVGCSVEERHAGTREFC